MIDEQTLAEMNGECISVAGDRPLGHTEFVPELDTDLIDQMLSLTPEQRLARHQTALNFLLEAESAGLNLCEAKQRFKGSNPFLKI